MLKSESDWVSNTGERPFKAGFVEVKYENGEREVGHAENFDWSKSFSEEEYRIEQWRPAQRVPEPKKVASASDSHYAYAYKGIRLDPYRIFDVYAITNAPQQHAIKKLLRAGKSVKSLEQDIDEVIMTLNRWKEMLGEN